MNLKLVVLAIMLFSLAGCEATDGVLTGMFGWLPGYSSGSSSQPAQTSSGNTNTNNLDQNRVGNLPVAQIPDCGSSQYYDFEKQKCVCDSGYVMANGRCIKESSRECVFDTDCSPDGSTRSRCSSSTTKVVYRCDISTYKCIPAKGVGISVNCVSEYGQGYTCKNGNCVE